MRGWLPVAAGALLGAAGLLAADSAWTIDDPYSGSFESSAERWNDRFPDVPLQTHDGRTVRFFEDLIRGKKVGLNFFYCGCTKF